MDAITRKIEVPVSKETAFEAFVNQLNAWWPKQYTWSQQKLVEIKIDARKDGLCSETGPFYFRCDWGRVTEFDFGNKISFTWQISPKRLPEPDPHKASIITVRFREHDTPGTTIDFEHTRFENHGEGAAEYQQLMASPSGWDYILKRYQTFCEKG